MDFEALFAEAVRTHLHHLREMEASAAMPRYRQKNAKLNVAESARRLSNLLDAYIERQKSDGL